VTERLTGPKSPPAVKVLCRAACPPADAVLPKTIKVKVRLRGRRKPSFCEDPHAVVPVKVVGGD